MPAHLIAEEGPHRGLILDLEAGDEWIIGRDPDESDFVIEDSTVSRKHARLLRSVDGSMSIKNLSRVNPVLVNGEEKGKAIVLKEGDRIQIGNTVFLYSEESFPNTGTAPQKPKPKKKPGYDDIFGDLDEPEEEEAEEEQDAPKTVPPVEERSEPTAYDTIFEDDGSEEDLPFNLVSESPLMLKVISGPNAGAEIGIEKGRSYTIGKEAKTCDIVFQDLSVSRNHARLEVGNEGEISIEDLGSKNGTVVNGTPIIEKTAVTTQDLIAFGTTVFMIIDRDAPQETIYSPLTPSYEPPKMAHEVAADSEEKAEIDEERDWKQEPIPTKYLVGAGAFVAVFFVIFLSFFSLFKSNQIEVVHKEPVSEIKEALAKFTDVQFSYNPGSGKLFLVGHVLTGIDFEEMQYRISQIPFIETTENNVVIDDLVWKTMNEVLSGTSGWRGVSIHSPNAGKFVAKGYVPSVQEATQLSDYLKINFPYLDRLENQVVVEEVLHAQLQGMIGGQNLGGVTFQLSNGEVILSGRYNESLKSEFEGLLKQLHGISGVAVVKNFAMPTHANLAATDVTGGYLVTGSSAYDGRGYSVVLNGRIYTLGDRVDGMKITTIEPSTILLEKDGLKYKIDYTR